MKIIPKHKHPSRINIARDWLASVSLALCLTTSITACTNVEQKPEESPTAKPDKVELEQRKSPLKLPVLTVHEESIAKSLKVPGTVLALPDHFIKVSSTIAGKITAVKVVEGQKVMKGDLVAVLDARHIEDQLAQADSNIKTAEANAKQIEGNIAFAEENLARQKKLFLAEVIAQKDVIAAEGQLQNLQSQLDASKQQVKTAEAARKQILTDLDFTRIKSSISGVVSNRYLNVGDTADPNTAIVQVVDLTNVVVSASVPADCPQELKLGESADISCAALPGQIFKGVISEISPLVDAQSNTVRVQLKASNPNWKLKEGENVSVQIRTGTDKRAIMVPKTALVPNPDKPDEYMIYLLDSGKAKRLSVKTGTSKNDQIEIVSGLKSGDKVITKDVFGLPDDTQVEAQ